MIHVTVKLDDERYGKLKKLCEAQEMSIAAVCRREVKRYIDAQPDVDKGEIETSWTKAVNQPDWTKK